MLTGTHTVFDRLIGHVTFVLVILVDVSAMRIAAVHRCTDDVPENGTRLRITNGLCRRFETVEITVLWVASDHL